MKRLTFLICMLVMFCATPSFADQNITETISVHPSEKESFVQVVNIYQRANVIASSRQVTWSSFEIRALRPVVASLKILANGLSENKARASEEIFRVGRRRSDRFVSKLIEYQNSGQLFHYQENNNGYGRESEYSVVAYDTVLRALKEWLDDRNHHDGGHDNGDHGNNGNHNRESFQLDINPFVVSNLILKRARQLQREGKVDRIDTITGRNGRVRHYVITGDQWTIRRLRNLSSNDTRTIEVRHKNEWRFRQALSGYQTWRVVTVTQSGGNIYTISGPGIVLEELEKIARDR